MKVVSFNVNGVRSRLHQLEKLIELHQPDIIGLQETKVHDEEFPVAAIEAMGYHVEFFGQKGHYGVCLMSKQKPITIVKGLPEETDEDQKRMIMGTYATATGQEIKVLNGYFPQGESVDHPTKFPNKRRFYQGLQNWLTSAFSPDDHVVVMGDMNISSEDIDIGIGEDNRKRWLRSGKTSFQPEERDWLQRLTGWGLVDTFRAQHPEQTGFYSWFDYRSKGFDRDPRRGLRIDLILATNSLMTHCAATGIDYDIRGMEKPSDHCPVWAEFTV